MLAAVVHDVLRQHRADARQCFQLSLARGIQVKQAWDVGLPVASTCSWRSGVGKFVGLMDAALRSLFMEIYLDDISLLTHHKVALHEKSWSKTLRWHLLRQKLLLGHKC